jgi:uncharacterized protein (TIRG00374 family)
VISAVLLMAALLLGGMRWWILLRSAEIPLARWEAVRLSLIGAFFSTWLPGSAGGDMARALYLFKGLPARRITALLTIALDRAFALLGLLASALMLTLANRHSRMQPVITFYVCLTLGSLLLGAVLAIVAALAARFIRIEVWPKCVAKGRPVAHQLREATILITGHWGNLACCVLLSIIASMMVALGITVLSDAFAFGPAASVSALAGVIANIASAIPLTPGGLGIAETVFSKICQELGSPAAPYATIYLAFRIVMVIVSLTGAVFWLRQNHIKQPHKKYVKETQNA